MKIKLETFEEIHHQIWKELGRATQDRHHEWRTPVLTTMGLDGSPNGRIVVIRRVDPDTKLITIYTDSRSPKVLELKVNPHAQFVLWSTRLNWQLRVRVKIQVLTSGPLVEFLWQQVRQSKAAGDYIAPSAPGTVLLPDNRTDPTENMVSYFAVLQAETVEIDWLELSRYGHRRAKFCGDLRQWVSP